MVGKQPHAELQKTGMDAILFEGELGPVGNGRRGRDEGHGAVILCQQFSQHAAHVVVIVIVDDDAVLWEACLPSGHRE